MGEPLGLISGDDPRFRKFLSGHQAELPRGAEGDAAGTGGDTGANIRPPDRPFTGFERERDTYQKVKPVLLAQAAGQFIAVVGDDYAGPVDTFDEAARAGYARFGIGPLYIKQILAEEPTVDVSRDIGS